MAATTTSIQDLSFTSIAKVMDTWELARQKYGCDEQVGSEILLHMFRAAPDSKKVFGFRADQNIEGNPLLRMGVLVHAGRIIAMLDVVIALLGPDMDTVQEVLSELGERHLRHGVQKEFFSLLVLAVCASLQRILGDEWTEATHTAWTDVFGGMAEVIKAAM